MYGYGVPASPARRRPKGRVWAAAAATAVLLSAGFAIEVRGGPEHHRVVTVQPGDSLWLIAARSYPDADVRERVAEIEAMNRLAGPGVWPGQVLELPS